ncbi:MAG: 50S ribosomal protein L30 [Chitinivibrionales bacterium]|nr:50S ribosomal protein L30 [Chitinivibrionales bacterium]
MKVKITLKRSTIGQLRDHKLTVRSLGLRKIGSSSVHADNIVVRGMIKKVLHLVTVEELQGE